VEFSEVCPCYSLFTSTNKITRIPHQKQTNEYCS
jgi:hypothetical protein